MTTATLKKSHVDLRSVYLSAEFIRDHDLIAGQRYPLEIEELPDVEMEGTLQSTGLIGGVSPLYTVLNAVEGDQVSIVFEQGTVKISLAKARGRPTPQPLASTALPTESVFDRQSLRHLHFDAFNPASFLGWVPKGEPDVYFVFGRLQEQTDYRYCCASSQAILDQLGYAVSTDSSGQRYSKPDAILIERASGQYLIAEFKMNSADFKTNHGPEDVDVLVCWEHDERDPSKLPPIVLCLREKLAELVASGQLKGSNG